MIISEGQRVAKRAGGPGANVRSDTGGTPMPQVLLNHSFERLIESGTGESESDITVLRRGGRGDQVRKGGCVFSSGCQRAPSQIMGLT